MSVDVKTPTQAQFEHTEFHCGERPRRASESDIVHHHQDETTKSDPPKTFQRQNSSGSRWTHFQRQESATGKFENPVQFRKRRYSEKAPHIFKRRYSQRKEKIVLPTKFLLGGNINDPLNLNSLCDEEINRQLNEKTPVSSPIPTPAHRRQVQVIIPPNITDPLNLNSGAEIDLNLISPKGKKKKRNKHKKKSVSDSFAEDKDEMLDVSEPAEVSVTEEPSATVTLASSVAAKLTKVSDKIVSPVIPQTSPKSRKRKRNPSDTKPEPSSGVSKSLLTEESVEKPDKISPIKTKYKRQSSQPKFREKDEKFIYGNYSRYYGYRNPETEEDHRLKTLNKSWFEGKDVLDIGCNAGHLTLAIAKDFQPRKIVGMDIDAKLLHAARLNIRHYLSSEMTDVNKYPVSMLMNYGPIAAPGVSTEEQPRFPNNVKFMQGNIVLEDDALLELVKEEYDVILGLSITKWIHLNFGDQGLKRMFKRIYRQLRPGGKLILEPQSMASYKKKKKLTEKIFKTFQSIKLRPDQFTEYLLSREVGFSKCELLDVPFNKSQGFRRPILMYTKGDSTWSSARNTPMPETPKTTPKPE